MPLSGMQAVRAGDMTLTELAARLGITRGAVSQWEKVPAERVPDIEKHTGIPRYVLRPDLYERPNAL